MTASVSGAPIDPTTTAAWARLVDLHEKFRPDLRGWFAADPQRAIQNGGRQPVGGAIDHQKAAAWLRLLGMTAVGRHQGREPGMQPRPATPGEFQLHAALDGQHQLREGMGMGLVVALIALDGEARSQGAPRWRSGRSRALILACPAESLGVQRTGCSGNSTSPPLFRSTVTGSWVRYSGRPPSRMRPLSR